MTEVATIVERGRFVPANFFSFFTIGSNLFAVAILILSALALAGGKESRLITMLLGASTLHMIVTGIVFAVLLRGLDVNLTAVPWDNLVLHYIMPIVVALDWFINMPKTRIALKQALVWAVYPIAYIIYTLIRGPIVGWYPYPFLNPSENGYMSVAVSSISIGLVTVGLIWMLSWSTRRQIKP